MDKYAQARELFPADQHSQKSFGSRSEDWIEAHWIIERLNDVYGDQWQWECMRSQTHTSERRGKVYYEVEGTWRLTIPTESGDKYREGEGADGSDDLCNAKKGASSYAMRHAAKHFSIGIECWTRPISATPQKPAPQKPITPLPHFPVSQVFAELDKAFVHGAKAAVQEDALTLLERLRTKKFVSGETAEEIIEALKLVAETCNPKEALGKVKTAHLKNWEDHLSSEQFREVIGYMKTLGTLLPTN